MHNTIIRRLFCIFCIFCMYSCFVSDGIHAKPKTQRPDSAGSGSVSVVSIGQVPGCWVETFPL